MDIGVLDRPRSRQLDTRLVQFDGDQDIYTRYTRCKVYIMPAHLSRQIFNGVMSELRCLLSDYKLGTEYIAYCTAQIRT